MAPRDAYAACAVRPDAAVLVAAPDKPPELQRPAELAILVELPSGARMHVMAGASADLVTATLRALR